MYNISYVKSKSYSFIPAYERIARYQGLIKTAVSSQCSLTRTNFHFKPIAWFSARMDVAMCCWIVQLESSFEHFATSCNILQWSDGFEAWPNMAEQCFHFALLSCAQLLQKAREVTDPWDLQQGWTKIELFALFRLLSSCCLVYSALEQGKVQVFHAFDLRQKMCMSGCHLLIWFCKCCEAQFLGRSLPDTAFAGKYVKRQVSLLIYLGFILQTCQMCCRICCEWNDLQCVNQRQIIRIE